MARSRFRRHYTRLFAAIQLSKIQMMELILPRRATMTESEQRLEAASLGLYSRSNLSRSRAPMSPQLQYHRPQIANAARRSNGPK